MTKELLTVELRYDSLNKYQDSKQSNTETITVGVYDDLKTAIIEGNKTLDKIAWYWDDNKKTKNKIGRFEEVHLWGRPKRLVSDLDVTHNTGVRMFAKIEQLKFKDVEQTVKDSIKKARELKLCENICPQ